MFSTQSKTEIIILATFYLSSANALNLVMSKLLSFGKDLTYTRVSFLTAVILKILDILSFM